MQRATGEEKLFEVADKNAKLELIEPHIYSIFSGKEELSAYDGIFGDLYDLVACNRFYNRFAWGYWPGEFDLFCRKTLSSARDGAVLDVGCGSLAFTVEAYSGNTGRPVILLDQSLKLLKKAKSALIKRNGRVPSNMVFVHASALQLPFETESFEDAISLNLLHVLEDIGRVLLEIKKVLKKRARTRLTTLVQNNRYADKYLGFWAESGQVVDRSMRQILNEIRDLDMDVESRLQGNMAFITCTKKE